MKNGDVVGDKARPESKEKTRRGLLHASAEPKRATATTRTESKLADGELAYMATVHLIYRIATRFKTQITPKFM